MDIELEERVWPACGVMQKNYPPEKIPKLTQTGSSMERRRSGRRPQEASGQAHPVGGKPCHSPPMPTGRADVYRVHGGDSCPEQSCGWADECPLGVAWTVSVEIRSYVLFPILCPSLGLILGGR